MRLIILTAVLSTTLIAGCGHSPATTFLVIDATPPTAPAAAYAGPPLRVPFVHLPVTVDRPELVRQDAAGTIRVDDFARWSAPLGAMARNALIQNLTARLPIGSVLPPDAPAAQPELRVEVTVLSIEMAAGNAAMIVSYRLFSAGAGPRPSVIRFSTPLLDDSAPSRAQAWTQLLAKLSDGLIAKLQTAELPSGRR